MAGGARRQACASGNSVHRRDLTKFNRTAVRLRGNVGGLVASHHDPYFCPFLSPLTLIALYPRPRNLPHTLPIPPAKGPSPVATMIGGGLQVGCRQTHVGTQRPPSVPWVKVPGWPHFKADGFAKNPARGGDVPLKNNYRMRSRRCPVPFCLSIPPAGLRAERLLCRRPARTPG